MSLFFAIVSLASSLPHTHTGTHTHTPRIVYHPRRFRRFVEAASCPVPRGVGGGELRDNNSPTAEGVTPCGTPSTPGSCISATTAGTSGDGAPSLADDEESCGGVPPPQFSTYMAHLLYPAASGGPEVAWLNAVTGRLLFDFLHNPYWANKVRVLLVTCYHLKPTSLFSN